MPNASARRVVGVLSVCMALQTTGLMMIQLLFAKRMESFGAGVEALSASATAYALTGMLAAPFAGALADRIGRRAVALLSLVAQALASLGYLLASSALAIILLRGLAGVFAAGLTPAILGIVGDHTPEGRRARWIGIVNGGAAAGCIIGPVLGGQLYDRFGYAVAIGVSIGAASLAFILSLLLIPGARPSMPGQSGEAGLGTEKRPSASLRGLSSLWPVLVVACVTAFGWAFIEPSLNFYVYHDLQWSSSQLGLVMSAYGAAMALAGLTLSRLSDRWGRSPAIVLGLCLYLSQFVVLVLCRVAAPIVLGFVFAGIGNALYDPALNALLLDAVPADRRARALGIKSTAGSLGSVLGPTLATVASRYAAPRAIFGIAGALAAAATVGVAFWRGPVPEKQAADLATPLPDR